MVDRDSGVLAGLPVGLEIGPRRRVFAQAVGWPGWCRSGRDEERAIATLVSYADRYRAAIGSEPGAPFAASTPRPTIMERVDGDATTDFGAPGAVLSSDRAPLEAEEPERLATFLDACWSAFDAALAATPSPVRAVKPEVGRAPDGIRLHVLGAARAYLAWLVKPAPRLDESRVADSEDAIRVAFRTAVAALPPSLAFESERHPGPYAVRRECWHVLDHAWELEDRLRAAR